MTDPDDLFAAQGPRPLADRMRPKSLEQVVGQEHLLGRDGMLRHLLRGEAIPSVILWGPPGSGKTTIASLLADSVDLKFEPLSAVFSGISDIRKVFERARERRRSGLGTLLFIDEIHRFNKAQQDGFLPVVEDGTVTLVGATTENPSFEINSALLSRCQVLLVNRLSADALETLVQRVETDLGTHLPLTPEARSVLIAMADGDGRYLLNMVEAVLRMAPETPLDPDSLSQAVTKRAPLYDKGDEAHYNTISALHKALRGSDVDAALYWLARMLAGGEAAAYIARRLVRFASEDIGLADPNALVQALAAWDAYDRLGSPEGELALAQSVIYLATAPKSNAAYVAEKAAKRAAKKTGSLMPPAHSLNAPTSLMKDLGYGAGYQYDHDTKGGFAGQSYFPDDMARRKFYDPKGKGFEAEIAKRLSYWDSLRRENQSKK